MRNIHTKALRVTATGLFFVMSAGTLLAQNAPAGGERRKPPKEAVEACKALAQGQACSFAINGKKMDGACWAPADKPLACRPKGGPVPGANQSPKK